ncbi:MAG: shikimate kinase [Dehalococcoidia bacterium]|nr:MAG: shikimate kinase [Dehalococcoidia bacterium]
MKTNIALIGFMGVGKTAVAKVLAYRLGKKLVELDGMIKLRAGKSITDIFRQEGEIAFRKLEIEITRKVAMGSNQVIACGGGIVLNKINIERLKKRSVIIYLMATPEVIIQRVDADSTIRPLLLKGNRALTIRKMLEFRQPFYDSAADIKIDTSYLNIAATVDNIIDRLKEYESFN